MTLPTPAERQKQRRASMRERGYKLLDIEIPPDLWQRLQPELEQYQGEAYPGHALVKLLEEWTPE